MNGRHALLLVLLSLAACTTRHQAKPISLASVAPQSQRERPLAVTSQALQPGKLRMEHGAAAMEIDTAQYADTLVMGIAKALLKSGFSIQDDAEDQLRVTFDYATLVPGAWKMRCYVDVTAETSSGVRRGFQGRGEQERPQNACQQALTDTGSQILSSPEVRKFLSGDGEEPAAGDAEQAAPDGATDLVE
jgi:hypothetical protein